MTCDSHLYFNISSQIVSCSPIINSDVHTNNSCRECPSDTVAILNSTRSVKHSSYAVV